MSLSRPDWQALWRRLGGAPGNEADYRDLLRRYAEPWRHYHNVRHLEECLRLFSALRHLAGHPDEVELALWFHDAVYDVRRHDNEQRSADLACRRMLAHGLAPEPIGRVRAMILATRHGSAPADRDTAIALDVDLSILAATPSRFDEYQKQIRDEYRHIPGPIFADKRREILQGFLSRPRIFATDLFHERYETNARANLFRALTSLRSAND